MAFAFPKQTHALCFLTCFTPSAEANSGAVVPDSGLALLTAATNPDPNPAKGASDLNLTEGSALIAEAGPGGSAPDTISVPKSSSISSYTVVEGDTLSEIAEKFGVSTNTILWANNLTLKSTIKPGMTLLILPVSGVEHTVLSGETLASLATKYHADATEIATYNGLESSASLTAGTKIIIPGGEIASTASSAKSSSTVKSSSAKSPSTPRGLSGSGGRDLSSFWTSNPLPHAILTQGIHDTNAVDLGSPVGTPISAIGPGKVIFVSRNGSYNHGWGNDVIIDHGNGVQTLYAHMSTVSVSVGQSVSGGTVIGAVGMTGDTTGPHLHIEVRGALSPFAKCTLRSLCTL
ncbi:MAG TPA: M23 family metallopeptidase [Candidatus Paceibacterota bacterium]|nr:M23 family metallopeptidase [Candidatus Paceibacterota bacterium]